MAKTIEGKHKQNLDQDKMEFACELISQVKGKQLAVLQQALTIMEFGGITATDMSDWLEATGGKL